MENKKDLHKIKLVVFDFDGVFTDNKVIVDEDGRESVVCCRSDGIGLANLHKKGKNTLVLSAEKNSVVNKRCEKLNVECIHGCADKLAALKELISQRAVEPSRVCYVGNDINDLACLQFVGFPMVVADALESIKPYALYITQKKGGCGAVREVCDLISQACEEEKECYGEKNRYSEKII